MKNHRKYAYADTDLVQYKLRRKKNKAQRERAFRRTATAAILREKPHLKAFTKYICNADNFDAVSQGIYCPGVSSEFDYRKTQLQVSRTYAKAALDRQRVLSQFSQKERQQMYDTYTRFLPNDSHDKVYREGDLFFPPAYEHGCPILEHLMNMAETMEQDAEESLPDLLRVTLDEEV